MDKPKALRVILVLALAAIVFGWLLGTVYLYGLACVLLLIGLSSDRLTGWIAAGWMKLAGWLGAFNSKVLLGLVFYVFLTPMAFLYRWFASDQMRLRPTDTDTYFDSTEESLSGEDFENPW